MQVRTFFFAQFNFNNTLIKGEPKSYSGSPILARHLFWISSKFIQNILLLQYSAYIDFGFYVLFLFAVNVFIQLYYREIVSFFYRTLIINYAFLCKMVMLFDDLIYSKIIWSSHVIFMRLHKVLRAWKRTWIAFDKSSYLICTGTETNYY